MRGSKLRREERRHTAELAKKAREERGDEGQLLRLERSGHGHCKEAKRLRKKLRLAGN